MEDFSVYTETALSQSVIYNTFNKSSGMTATILKIIQNSMELKEENMEEQFYQIKRTSPSPLTNKVISAFEDGAIKVLYCENKTIKVPHALPFIALKSGAKITAMIFVNNYGKVSNDVDGNAVLDMHFKDLYVLMEGAYTAYMYNYTPQLFNKSLPLLKLSSIIYTMMINRVLNKEHAITMDPTLNAQITYSVSAFFIDQVWGYHNPNIIFAYAKDSINSPVDSSLLIEIRDAYEKAEIKNIEELIKFISNINARMKGLNFRYFLEQFILTYKAGAMFGLECLPYFLYIVQSSLLGSFIINGTLVRDVTKYIQGINRFYPELNKIL